MKWTIKNTETFQDSLSRIYLHPSVVREIGKKIKRLEEDPNHVGGWLQGPLHGNKSTRIAKKYRLIFSIDEKSHTVYLILIDHRENVYKRF
jgi:mRNA-degrading endonuclease RelE of RelBE toxin-antitoxin system